MAAFGLQPNAVFLCVVIGGIFMSTNILDCGADSETNDIFVYDSAPDGNGLVLRKQDVAYNQSLRLCAGASPRDHCPPGGIDRLSLDLQRFSESLDVGNTTIRELVRVMRGLKGSEYHCFFLKVFGEGKSRTMFKIQKIANLMIREYMEYDGTDPDKLEEAKQLGVEEHYKDMANREFYMDIAEEIVLVFGLRRDPARL